MNARWNIQRRKKNYMKWVVSLKAAKASSTSTTASHFRETIIVGPIWKVAKSFEARATTELASTWCVEFAFSFWFWRAFRCSDRWAFLANRTISLLIIACRCVSGHSRRNRSCWGSCTLRLLERQLNITLVWRWDFEKVFSDIIDVGGSFECHHFNVIVRWFQFTRLQWSYQFFQLINVTLYTCN